MVKGNGRAPEVLGSSSRGSQGLSLTGLYVYPVKSARGIAVTSARAVATGFEYDRRWMVVDDAGRFVTQRTHPRLARVDTSLTDDELVLSSKGHGEVRVPLLAEPDVAEPVTVWHDTLPAAAESAQVAAFFSDLLGGPHRLVRFPEAGERAVRREGRSGAKPERSVGEDTAVDSPAKVEVTGRRVQFADAFPFLLISQGSLDLLNEKLAAKGEERIGMERFRPNLVVSGCDPHAEDAWTTLVIGDIRFDVAKPCARCSIPQVDPVTAEVGREPARTLATYRRLDGKVLFGQNLVHHDQGVIRLGQAVSAT